MFAYPLPSIPTHFQPILIENQSNPIGIDPKSEFSLRFYPTNDINEQDPYVTIDFISPYMLMPDEMIQL